MLCRTQPHSLLCCVASCACNDISNCMATNTLWVVFAPHERVVTCHCRTPQGLRSLARFYMVVIIPLFFGPYYSELRQQADSFAFPLFLAIVVSMRRLFHGSCYSSGWSLSAATGELRSKHCILSYFGQCHCFMEAGVTVCIVCVTCLLTHVVVLSC